MPIEIDKIFDPKILDCCKVHAARWNFENQPLDVFLRNENEWLGWNRWRGTRNEFNKAYICSFIQFYPEGRDTWLFGGFFKILSRRHEPNTESYDIVPVAEGADLIGRLKMTGKIPRGRAFRPDTFFRSAAVSEILRERYQGEGFRGYNNCSLDFTMLEIIFRNNRVDWKTALEHINGIYLISDKKNGKKYVGSAYGESGLWQRWGQYVASGHGWNKNLIGLATEEGIAYLRENFRFTLIEQLPYGTDKNFVIAREGYWKEVLLSRQFGYNAN